MSDNKIRKSGFTFIELVIALVLLGIIAAIAAPKYFDMQEQSELTAVKAAVTEAQSRLNARFAQLVLNGSTCAGAVENVANLAHESNNQITAAFGDFTITPQQLTVPDTGEGTLVTAQLTGTDRTFENVGRIFLPVCATESTGATTAPPQISEIVEVWIGPSMSGMLAAALKFPATNNSSANAWNVAINSMGNGDFATSDGSGPLVSIMNGYANGASWQITKNEDGTYDIMVTDTTDKTVGILYTVESDGSVSSPVYVTGVTQTDDGRYTYNVYH